VGSNGSGGYTYVLNEDLLNTSGNAAGVYTGLSAGSYTVTITDSNGCDATTTTITVTDPAAVGSTASKTDIVCNGDTDGTVTGVGTGGTGTLAYDLEDGVGTPIANTTGDVTGAYTGLGAGTYRVRVTDDNACTTVSSNVVIADPVLLTAGTTDSEYNGFDISCNGDSDGYIEVTAAGGTGAYTFTLGGTSAEVQTQPGTVYRFNSLIAGAYTVDVVDANACSITQINITLTEPTAITAAGSVTNLKNGSDVSCNGDSDGEITAV
jgi:hypothetical protein